MNQPVKNKKVKCKKEGGQSGKGAGLKAGGGGVCEGFCKLVYWSLRAQQDLVNSRSLTTDHRPDHRST